MAAVLSTEWAGIAAIRGADLLGFNSAGLAVYERVWGNIRTRTLTDADGNVLDTWDGTLNERIPERMQDTR